jgi:putative holliday junction resolvase
MAEEAQRHLKLGKKPIIAFDFGTKRIGVAVGQALTCTATPLPPLPAQAGVPNWDAIKMLEKTWDPQAWVVGLPLHMNDTEQPITQRVRLFIEALKLHTKLNVYEMDERLSTLEARSQLFEAGGYSALQKKSIDSFAAKLILERWFRS